MSRLLAMSKWVGRLGGLLLALMILFAVHARANDPDALWKIVDGQCVPDQKERANPAPCAEVSVASGADSGFAVLKDNAPSKPYHYLLIPTRRITGIESPSLLAPDAPGYFQDAFAARSYVANAVHAALAPDMIGLAVNAANFRSQNQLHIHIDCVRPEVRAALKAQEPKLADRWAELDFGSPDGAYLAMRLSADAFARANPLLLLADGVAGAREHMDL